MTRKQSLTSIVMFVLILLAVAAAAYAPRNAGWVKYSQTAPSYAPCSAANNLVAKSESSTGPKYPVPSPDVIARGHSVQ